MLGKSVTSIVEKGANYFFHLQAVARINCNSGYADMYQDSVYSDDLAYLKQNKEFFLFGNGRSFSPFTLSSLFIPSMLNLDTECKLNEYFSCLSSTIKHKDAESFVNEYQKDFDKVEKLIEDYPKIIQKDITTVNEKYMPY